MKTAIAVVRRIDGPRVEIEVLSEGCGRCHETGGCGGQNLARAFCGGKRYWIVSESAIEIGNRVKVGIDAGSIRVAASRTYVVPLTAMLAGAFLGARLGSFESALGALAGLAMAWLWLTKSNPTVPAPVIIGPTVDGA